MKSYYEVLVKENTGHGKYGLSLEAKSVAEAKTIVITQDGVNPKDIISVRKISEKEYNGNY